MNEQVTRARLERFAAMAAELRRRENRERQSRRGGLIEFVRHFWRVLEPVADLVDGWPLEAICAHLEAVTFGEINRLLVNVPPGFMKAIDCDTPVLTTLGWKRHGDLKRGDFVFSPGGLPVRVQEITRHKAETAYEIEFDDETKLVAGAGHLWKVERDYPYANRGRRCRRDEIVTTPELIPSVKGRAIQRPDRIPLASSIQFPPRRLLIDPYVLGTWLGDGASNGGDIYTGEQDREHFSALGRVASTVVGRDGRQDFHRINVENLRVKLRVMGLLNNKHIPDDYLESSEDQRLALLQGLMDTDGCATKTGTCTFVSKWRHLADQINFLLCSLGVKSNVKEQWSVVDGRRFGPYWQVTFTAPPGMQVFRLKRKQDRVKFSTNKRSRGRYVKSLREIGERWVNCIQVEGGMYLVGRRLVPTHNSLLTDVFWPAWEWGPMEMPHLRYVAFSYSAGLTERDNGKFRDLVLSREYQELWGGAFQLRKIGETKVTNDKTGSKLATSVGGIGTGERGDRAICDDLHNIKESESETIRTETVRWFREALSNRLNDLSRSAIVVIMQRVHESDVSGTILDDFDSYTHLMIPMEYDSDRHCETEIGWSDPRTEDGELAWPERFPAKDVEDIKRAVGPFAYASQYQQRPAPREGGIIKPDWWRVWDKEIALRYGLDWNDERPGGRKEYPPFSIVIASLDAAYTKDKANDYSALTLWGLWNDRNGNRRLMMSYAWHDRLELHDLVRRVAETCKKHQVDRLLIEAKASGISVGQEIRRIYGAETFGVELLNPGNLDKVARAHSIVPLFAEGVIWAPVTNWSSEVIDECSTFPKGAHDDYVDSATQAIRWLRDQGLAERSQEREFAEHEAMSDWRQRPAIYDV